MADTHLEGTGVPLSFPGGSLPARAPKPPCGPSKFTGVKATRECPQSTQLTLTQRSNTLVRTLLCSIQIPLMLIECAILQEPVQVNSHNPELFPYS